MSESLEKLAARAEVYRLLSQAYYSPEKDFLKGPCLDAARGASQLSGSPVLVREWQQLVNYLETVYEPVEVAVEYTRLFRGPVKAEVYPYESMHVDGEAMGKSALDVAKRYGEAGVSVAEEFKDLPDHISAELEFMHYLCGRELDALQKGANEEAARFQQVSETFLKDHLGQWVPRFTSLVMQHAATPYYLAIAEITQAFIRQEMDENRLDDAGDENNNPANHDGAG